jgi:hypothetical protein
MACFAVRRVRAMAHTDEVFPVGVAAMITGITGTPEPRTTRQHEKTHESGPVRSGPDGRTDGQTA